MKSRLNRDHYFKLINWKGTLNCLCLYISHEPSPAITWWWYHAACRFAFCSAGTTLHQPWCQQSDDGLESPATYWHVTLDKQPRVKPHVLQFGFCIILHKKNGAVIVCWCLNSILTTLSLETEISWIPLPCLGMLSWPSLSFFPYILNTKIPTWLFISFCAPCLF